MTGFFELFNPGQRHSREQKDFDKVAVVPTRKGGRGPLRIDLDAGTVMLPARKQSLSQEAVVAVEPTDQVSDESDDAVSEPADPVSEPEAPEARG